MRSRSWMKGFHYLRILFHIYLLDNKVKYFIFFFLQFCSLIVNCHHECISWRGMIVVRMINSIVIGWSKAIMAVCSPHSGSSLVNYIISLWLAFWVTERQFLQLPQNSMWVKLLKLNCFLSCSRILVYLCNSSNSALSSGTCIFYRLLNPVIYLKLHHYCCVGKKIWM